jgi:hypothetical protein
VSTDLKLYKEELTKLEEDRLQEISIYDSKDKAK